MKAFILHPYGTKNIFVRENCAIHTKKAFILLWPSAKIYKGLRAAQYRSSNRFLLASKTIFVLSNVHKYISIEISRNLYKMNKPLARLNLT